MGCILCILGASILALNAPETQSVTTVPQLQKLWVSPGEPFLGLLRLDLTPIPLQDS
jgi:hypothetical protein